MSFVTVEGPLRNWIESSISPILPKNKYIDVFEIHLHQSDTLSSHKMFLGNYRGRSKYCVS